MTNDRLLRVTFRRVLGETTGAQRLLAVFCPRRVEVVDVRECQHCSHCQGLCIDPTDRDTLLRCEWSSANPPEPPPRRASEAGPSSREIKLGAVMTTPARCITADASLAELVRIFVSEGISAAPVVDAEGRPVGIVSKTDVLRWCVTDEDAPASDLEVAIEESLDVALLRESGEPSPQVRDVMTHVVFTLHSEASLSRAAALMAFEGVHRIVVVAADGRPIGIVSSLDVLRWIAQQDGYIVPGRPRPMSHRPEEP